MLKIKVVIASVLFAGILAGGYFAFTDSNEERAAKLYASARTYAASGDPARAMIELRNAIQAQPDQVDARIMLAELLREDGRDAEAFDQYRTVFNYDPANTTAARAMARIAFGRMAWEEARGYAGAVLSTAPTDPEARAILAGISYHEAVRDQDDARREQVYEEAKLLLSEDPKLLSARQIVISEYILRGETERATKAAEDGLSLDPTDRSLNSVYLSLLETSGNAAGAEQQLNRMIARFPEDEQVTQDLVRFYVTSGRPDEAEQRLRARISPDSSEPGPRLVLLRFLSMIHSPEATHAELVKLLAENPAPADVAQNRSRFEALKAQADYSLGRRDEAVAEMEGLIRDKPDSDEIDNFKVVLAGMRLGMGQAAAAETLVDEVLAHDPGMMAALKMKGKMLTDRAEADAAIALLRDALTGAPTDPEIMTLLARAYELAGQPDLTADMFARAAEISGYAPRESLRYAVLRAQQGKYPDAEQVLNEALRRRPDDLDLRALLARVHIAMGNWTQAQDDIQMISERYDTEVSRNIALQLTSSLLSSQGREGDLTEFLDEEASTSDAPLSARIAAIRNTLATEGIDRAIAQAEALAADSPADAAPRMLIVQLKLEDDKAAEALPEAKKLVEDHPDNVQGWLLLLDAQTRLGQADEALATIDIALGSVPGNLALLMSKAGIQERRGDAEAAIAIYEGMYAAYPTDMIVANNLASLLGATRSDPESLDRAWDLARRLNGSQDPSFADTLGWIALRRGDATTALPLLKRAAAGLPEDASVAYHLGKAYAAHGQNDQARSEYDRADQLLAGKASLYPNIATDIAGARAELR